MITILGIWNNVWPYLVAVLVFIVLIIIHEFGHFIAAKSVGVRVNEFAVGFGPKIFSKKWGETRYSVNLIPLGGYCAMEGEDEGSADSRAFCNKSAWRRLVIVVMGAVFNLLAGLIIIAIILAPQIRFTTTTVAEFAESSVSSQHGLEAGDKIIAVDGRRIFTTYDLSYAFTNVDDGTVDLTVVRDGKRTQLPNVKFATAEAEGITYLSVDFYVYGQEKTVGSYIKNIVNNAISYSAVVWRSLIDLITGKYGISAVSGPVGVTAAIGSAAKQSLSSLLPIMALITINLGIFNLLPVPALDGGRVLFILFEMIFRKPVPQRYEALVHGIGFALLIGFMLLITAKDIWSLFT
ncbi:MAG: site-2 protease family protein [Clostridia bacterium]|nr:site-2 protease family protein [Clostridia bacterium]